MMPESFWLESRVKYKLSFASSEKIKTQAIGEVVTSALWTKEGKTERFGLEDEVLFGPLEDFVCQCSDTPHDTEDWGSKCKKCGVEITTKEKRWERLGYIELPIAVVNPLAYETIGALLGVDTKIIEKLVTTISFFKLHPDPEGPIIFYDGSSYFLKEEEKENNRYKINHVTRDHIISPIGLYKLLQNIDMSTLLSCEEADISSSLQRIRGEWFSSGQRWQDLFIKRLPVKPPMLRQRVEISTNTGVVDNLSVEEIEPVVPEKISSDYTTHYQDILKECLKTEILSEHCNIKTINHLQAIKLQCRVHRLFFGYNRKQNNEILEIKGILPSLTGKFGWIRHKVMGKRIDYSGRSGITVDPLCSMDEIGMPYEMAYELFMPHIVGYLRREYNMSHREAKHVWQRHETIAYDALDLIVQHEHILLNRQPSLHRASIMAFKPYLHTGRSLKLPPLVCQNFNADYDGDQMACYLPLSKDAKREVKDLMFPKNNVLSQLDSSVTTAPSHEILLGLYFYTCIDEKQESFHITNARCFYVEELIEHEVIKYNTPLWLDNPYLFTCYGRQHLGTILQVEVEKPFTKSYLKEKLSESFDNLGREAFVEALDKIKEIGIQCITQVGFSLGMNDIHTPDNKYEILGDPSSERTPEEWLELLGKVHDEFENADRSNPLYLMLITGARVNKSQVDQLVVAKGLQTRFDGTITPQPVIHNLKEGLTPHEYWQTCGPARRAMASKKFSTPLGGYFCQKLVHLLRDFYIVQHDCCTSNLFYNHRSPIFCEAKGGICQACFGIDPSTRELVAIGTPIGIRVAQALSEPATQLSLGMKHTSGAVTKLEGDKNKDITGTLPKLMELINLINITDEEGTPLQVLPLNEAAELFVDTMLTLYNSEGIKPWQINCEMVFRGMSELTYDGSTYSLFRLTNEGERIILSVNGVLRHYPSWLKPMCFGFVKEVLQGAARRGDTSLDVSTEVIMRGMYNGT